MPPIEPPTTDNQRFTPRWSASAAWVRTVSRIDTAGNRAPYGVPVAGSFDAGPVVPWHPPRTLAQTTNQRSVSMARPGPTMFFHQPVVGWPWPHAARRMGVAGQRMADQHGVGCGGVQRAPGLVGDGDLVEHATALECEAALQGEEATVAHRVAGHPRSRRRHHGRVAQGCRRGGGRVGWNRC